MIYVTKKVLFCATVDYHLKAFHLPYLRWFKENGWEVHAAAKGSLELSHVDYKYNLPIERLPISVGNLKAYKELKRIIDNNRYDIIHCHTPMGGVLTRLAASQARKSGTKVIYTAHGFHFYRGAPLINWLVYYPVEKWLARCSDCLITINHEDYSLAANKRFRASQIDYVHGVGVNTEKFKPVTEEKRQELRRKHGYTPEQFILFYAAELNKNKNQYLLIKSIAKLKKYIPKIKLLLAGSGPLQGEYRSFAVKEGVHSEVDFLGHRSDTDELLKISDVAVASSYREGLPVFVVEAMACGLPIVASSNRGHCELIADGFNGFIITGNDDELFSEKLYALYKSPGLRMKMGNESVRKVARYQLTRVTGEMSKIYRRYM